MTLQERIQELVNHSKLSIPKFAEKVGFKTPQAVRELLSGNTKTLSEAAQHKIMMAFPELNEDWLTGGEGEMFKHASQSAGNVSGHNICGVNINGKEIHITCPDEYETLLTIVNENKAATEKYQAIAEKYQAQLDKAQQQIDELIALLKAKI